MAIFLSIQAESFAKGHLSECTAVNGSDIFYLISSFPMTYNEAYDYCEREGGILAEPRSSSQTENINTLLDDGNSYWIGLTDEKTEGLFLWNSDGQNTESYHNWGPSQPNNDGNCVRLYGAYSIMWCDWNCDQAEAWDYIYALCQKSV